MSKNTQYNIMVVSDGSADCLQFRVSKRTIVITAMASLAAIVTLVTMSLINWEPPSKKAALEALMKENEALKLANNRYLEATVKMEDKLRLFDEKTVKLAQFVGVEPAGLEVDGIGGPDLLDNELSKYLRYDLGIMEQQTDVLDDRFTSLEEAFANQTELLDATPSILPAHGWISSGYRYRTDPFTKKRTFHAGIDISCPEGTPVYAPANGVVSFRGFRDGFGNMLVLNHGNELKTRYGHLYKFNVSKGQRVKRGDLIAYVGNTGRSTAPHLHFEIHKNEKSINPMKYIIREDRSF